MHTGTGNYPLHHVTLLVFCLINYSNMKVDNNEVFLRVTNHTGQAEKNLLGPAGIRTRAFGLLVRWYGSSLGETPHYYSSPEFTVP